MDSYDNDWLFLNDDLILYGLVLDDLILPKPEVQKCTDNTDIADTNRQ